METAPPAPPDVPRRPRLPAWRALGLLAIAAVPLGAVVSSLGGDTGNLETVLRVGFVYLVLMLGFRFMGKRELGQLSQFELVTLMLIPEIVSPAMNQDITSMSSAVVGVCTLFALVTIFALLSHLSKAASAAFEGRPTVLVRHGRLDVDALNRERVTPEEVYSSMHQAGIERIETVKWGILEPEGRMAFITFGGPPEGGSAEPGMLA